MGSEQANAYELGGCTALRGLNWPHKRNAIDDAFLAELEAGIGGGRRSVCGTGRCRRDRNDRDSRASEIHRCRIAGTRMRGVLMSLLKEED
jgi:hypothetical protein